MSEKVSKDLVQVTRIIQEDGTTIYYLPSGYTGNLIQVSEGPDHYAETTYVKLEVAKKSLALKLNYDKVITDQKLENLTGEPKPK